MGKNYLKNRKKVIGVDTLFQCFWDVWGVEERM